MSLVVNLRQPGFWLIIVGLVLNFTVIVANGGYMPASPDAVAAWQGMAVLPTSAYTNSVIATGNRRCSSWATSSRCPRSMPLANIFSIGDVLIGVGGAWFVIATMHGRICDPRGPSAERHGGRHACERPTMPDPERSRLVGLLGDLCEAVGADGGGVLSR